MAGNTFQFGDEIEYHLVRLGEDEDGTKTAKLSLRSRLLLPELGAAEAAHLESATTAWRPEYGEFMIEATPARPFGGHPSKFATQIEANMRLRRWLLSAALEPGEVPVTLTNFPLLGLGEPVSYATPLDPTTPAGRTGGPVAASLFIADGIINHHRRFSTLTQNIRERRGERVCIKVPLFRDSATPPRPLHPAASEAERAALEAAGPAGDVATPHWPDPYTIYMDAMAFGMGMNCLQVTFQSCNIEEARFFYDQLACVTPVLMALTAASPIFRGFLADQDVRWNVIERAVDCRTTTERGGAPGKRAPFGPIPKSRYDSISTFLDKDRGPQFNDTDLVINEEALAMLQEAGLDDVLARHVAHLFIRDPLVIYDGRVEEVNDATEADHFENIQSTNWQSVRFKPPPPGSDIGWRVEFRVMEVQLTDFENAAFVVFVVLLSRAIMTMGLDFYLPISRLDENMARAHARDAVATQRFFFRFAATELQASAEEGEADPVRELSVDEIMNGSEAARTRGNAEEPATSESTKRSWRSASEAAQVDAGFVGLVPFVRMYLDSIEVVGEVRRSLDAYLNFIAARAAGELKTTAGWIRDFVRSHPSYRGDSIVTQDIAYDLLVASTEIAAGTREVPELVGDFAAGHSEAATYAANKAEWDEALAQLLADRERLAKEASAV